VPHGGRKILKKYIINPLTGRKILKNGRLANNLRKNKII
tara:strand:- start:4 stop:120 length:117 start_codon:yes stop_codon:yes gene_type:complete